MQREYTSQKDTSGVESKLRVCERRTGVRILRLQALFEREETVGTVKASRGRVDGVVGALGDVEVGADDLHQSGNIRTTPRERGLSC